jgi:hypothetical protein
MFNADTYLFNIVPWYKTSFAALLALNEYPIFLTVEDH